MKGKQGQIYAKEFKLQAVKLVMEQGMTATQVAKDLGVSVTSVAGWVRSFKANGQEAFPGRGNLLPQDEEIRRLQRENRRLEMERDILKKALVYFTELEKRNMDSSTRRRKLEPVLGY